MCIQYTSNTVHTQQCVHNIHTNLKSQGTSGEGENANVLLQEWLIAFDYKRQNRRRVVKIQSALCEVACAQNSRCLKIAVVKIYQKVVSASENRNVKSLMNRQLLLYKLKTMVYNLVRTIKKEKVNPKLFLFYLQSTNSYFKRS